MNTVIGFFQSIVQKAVLKKKILFFILAGFIAIGCVGVLDVGLALGLTVVVFLSSITCIVLYKCCGKDPSPYLIFFLVLSIHLAAAIFIWFTGFKPFSGGSDYEGYHQAAVSLSGRFVHGDFSLAGLHVMHFFPVFMAVFYILTSAEMIVGQCLVAFFAGISVLLMYFLAREIGSSKKSAALACLIVAAYPSYLYFGSVLLKDTMVIPLVLATLLLLIRMIKNGPGLKFVAFFLILIALVNLRFYVGFAVLFTFVVCWFFLSSMPRKHRISQGIVMILILGFSPYLLGYGYFGLKPLTYFLNRDVVTRYREVVYAPSPDFIKPTPLDSKKDPGSVAVKKNPSTGAGGSSIQYIFSDHPPDDNKEPQAQVIPEPSENSGKGSSFVVSAGFDNPFEFVKNYLLSFTYSAFGPFPWQLRYQRHLLFLLETIPWYIILGFFFHSVYTLIKKRGWFAFFGTYKFALPIVMFSAMAFGALSLYINNFGIIIRIRMPMFIVLMCVISLGFTQTFVTQKRLEWIRNTLPIKYIESVGAWARKNIFNP
ncbi:hypothetical protein KW786_00695 [Candidatus Parcubacteria bacterium]|nr:hypothetical protein [Candidatus Parcubacteria bacterium]